MRSENTEKEKKKIDKYVNKKNQNNNNFSNKNKRILKNNKD